MRKCVYLTGKMAGRTYESAFKERDHIATLLLKRGWEVLDPLRGREILSTLKEPMDGPETIELLGVTDAALIQRDEDDVRRADVLLVLTGNTPSWGSAFEWAEMAIMHRKPVVVIGKKYENHPWCKHYASYFADTAEEAVEFLDTFLDRGYRLDKLQEEKEG